MKLVDKPYLSIHPGYVFFELYAFIILTSTLVLLFAFQGIPKLDVKLIIKDFSKKGSTKTSKESFNYNVAR